MKPFCLTTALTLAMTVSFQFAVTHAECDSEVGGCIKDGNPCTGRDEECCEGLGCFGFNFFKRCQDPPLCLHEWHDCSQGIDCCGDLVCADIDRGFYECQQEKIGTRTVDIPGGLVITETEPPTATPVKKNLVTTKVPGQPVEFNIACATGDPHIDTFDGLDWDCQAHGEYILVKSTITQREIQGRFTQLKDKKASVMRGVVIQDEGNTPKVQLTMPVVDEGISHVLGDNGCKIQLFVDGQQKDLFEGSGTDAVSITVNKNKIRIKYTESEMSLTVKMGYWNGCLLNTCYRIPDTDPVIGILGSPDGDINNDWMSRDGTPLAVPKDMVGRLQEEAYDYCTKNWCIQEEVDSLFTYNQLGLDFEDFERCTLPYGELVTDEIELQATLEIETTCGDDFACITDAVLGGVAAAQEARTVRLELKETCNNEGGECRVADCCDGYKCIDKGMAGKVCVPMNVKHPKCMVRNRLFSRSPPSFSVFSTHAIPNYTSPAWTW
jgi:hypothetical protein